MNELDTMLKSYKPGLDDEERYRMMEHTGFYKTAYPNSAFNARLQSFSHRVKSAVPGGRKAGSSMQNSQSCASSSIQA